jgi:hypothetical protein
VGAGLNPVAFLGFLARRDPHDLLDGVADNVGGALLASGSAYLRRADPSKHSGPTHSRMISERSIDASDGLPLRQKREAIHKPACLPT